MAWAKPKFGSGEINRAGKQLIASDDKSPEDWERIFTVINNWRSCHGYPLLSMRMTLATRAKAIDSRAIIAQRLKRMVSIHVKLIRNHNMALSQMQDIGGCRAVMRGVRHVDRLVKAYEDYTSSRPQTGPEFLRKYDYI